MIAAARGADFEIAGERAPSVALVGPLPPPEAGMANQTRQLEELLRGDGIRVEVLRTNLPLRPRFLDRLRGIRALLRLCLFVARLWTLTGRGEVVHVLANSGWSWYLVAVPAILVGRVRRRPVIVNYRGGGARRFLERESTWVLPMLRLASAVVVPSAYLRGVFDEHGVDAQLIANVVDVHRFMPSDYDTLCRQPDIHVVSTRNLEPIYDVETAIRAFAHVSGSLPAVCLTVAGDGPERGRLEALAQTLGLAERVTFRGRIDRDEMAALLRSARLLLNSSRVDNMPNSLLEALATGLPLVSTNVGGIPHIIEDGVSGILVPPGDPRAMADAALRLLGDEAFAGRMAAAAARAARRYTWEVVGKEWLDVYRSVRRNES